MVNDLCMIYVWDRADFQDLKIGSILTIDPEYLGLIRVVQVHFGSVNFIQGQLGRIRPRAFFA